MSFKIETSEHLEFILDFEEPNAYVKIGELLLEALNDWPTQDLTQLDNFVSELSDFFRTPLTIENIKSKQFNGENAWQLESAASIEEILNLSTSELGINNLNEVISALVEYFETEYCNTDFVAELKYRTSEEGGRSTPAFSKYRPQVKFDFEQMQTSGEQTFINKTEVFPGGSVRAKFNILGVELFKYRLEAGMIFEFLEGSRVIGTGQITGIINEELKKPAGNKE